MPPRSQDEVRTAFLEYFGEHAHKVVPSYSLIPPEDPTLLFVNAGMVQFKDVFTGMRKVTYARATSSQKCLRVSGKHNDLHNVGRTARHHTFFEMLGNFSFGDYFKKEAIEHGWRLLTEVYGLDPERMWVAVYPEDEEAFSLWKDHMGFPEERIYKDPDAFWAMGDTGPCGPCSELYYDQGPAHPGWEDAVIGDDSDRFLELWNLVFMQFERKPDGEMLKLPRPSIDTGMGLERLVAVLQGHTSNYDSDLFRPLISVVESVAGQGYGSDETFDLACRVIADHARAAAFLIADGVYPENEGRGYVLRRVLRRAIRFARRIGIEREPVCHVADKVVDVMHGAYPELEEARPVIARVLRLEEERFGRTLAEGERLLDRAIKELEAGGGEVLDGDLAFTLYDTHGFPLDLTELIAAEHGLGVDQGAFQEALQAQRTRSRAVSTFGGTGDTAALDGLVEAGVVSEFVGYEHEGCEATVLALVQDGARVERLAPGSDGEVLLDRTPFYSESGGQVGDRGAMLAEDKLAFEVKDAQRHGDALIRHIGRVPEEAPALVSGQRLQAEIDHGERTATRANHSATHLLHLALREVLGEHVRQRGSYVSPDRLRFDFSHFGPMTHDEIERVELRVNELVRANHEIETAVLPFEEATKSGAIAFFDEKYGDTVRVLRIGPSVELCGGTHARRTGDVGFFSIISEGSVQSGVRRVEARTAEGADAWVHALRRDAQEAAGLLNTSVAELKDKLGGLLRQRKELEKELERAAAAKVAGPSAAAELATVGEVRVKALHLSDADRKTLLPALDRLREESEKSVVLVTGLRGGQAAVLLGATDDLTESVHAGNLLKEILTARGGRGGGNARTGQGGLNPAERDTLRELEASLVEQLRVHVGA